jgi:hypothetical protein
MSDPTLPESIDPTADEAVILTFAAQVFGAVAAGTQTFAKTGKARDDALDYAAKESVYAATRLIAATRGYLAAVAGTDSPARALVRGSGLHGPSPEPWQRNGRRAAPEAEGG